MFWTMFSCEIYEDVIRKTYLGRTCGHLKYSALSSRVPCWICTWSRSLWAKQSLSSTFWTKVAPSYVTCPTQNSRSRCFQRCRRRCCAVRRTPCRVRQKMAWNCHPSEPPEQRVKLFLLFFQPFPLCCLLCLLTLASMPWTLEKQSQVWLQFTSNQRVVV